MAEWTRVLTKWRSRKSQRGAAALEFALVAPILIVLVFGVVDFGIMTNSQAVFANASRDAARAGSFSSSKAAIEGVVLSGTDYLPNTTNRVISVTCKKPNGTACGSNYDTEKAAGGTVTVVISYQHHWMTPALLGLPSVTTITKRSEMRIE